MATATLAVIQTTLTADTAPTPNTGVMRDNAGGITVAVCVATELETTLYSGTVVTKTTSFTAANATDYLVDCTAGAVTVTLPLASANAGTVYHFTKKDSSGNAITLTGALGGGSISSQYSSKRVFGDGTNWYSV